MKKRRSIIAIALALVMLSGCSSGEVAQGVLTDSSVGGYNDDVASKPSPSKDVVQLEQIKSDLVAQEPIFNENMFDIHNFEIDKRQTTIEDKTDIIYVSGSAANDAVEYDFSYKLTYNLYNEGWILDVISEQESNYLPLMTPTREVIESIITNSYPYPNYDYCEIYRAGLQDDSIFSITLEDIMNGVSVEELFYDWEDYSPFAIPEDKITDDAKFGITAHYYNLFPYAREEMYYGHTLVFDDSKLEWVHDSGAAVTEERKEYDLEGVWTGEDYSVEVIMSDVEDLNSITANITDLRTGELVYSGGINDHGTFGDQYMTAFANRYEPYNVFGSVSDRQEFFDFSDEGVYYFYDIGYSQYTKSFYLTKQAE